MLKNIPQVKIEYLIKSCNLLYTTEVSSPPNSIVYYNANARSWLLSLASQKQELTMND